MRVLTTLIAAALMVAPACAEDAAALYATVKTSKGDFVVALDPAAAPQTVENFVQYANAGHYDRSIIHRVVAGYVIQGGGYSRFFNERATRPAVPYEGDNGLKNVRGAFAMARTSDPNSATSQWYVNLQDNAKLDHKVDEIGPIYGYTVFGQVIAGMDVVDAIGAVETGEGGPFETEVPVEQILVERVDVGNEPPAVAGAQ
ncbi:MAG: peptidylprolyl isomerase [Pseudomonadota bacterium]